MVTIIADADQAQEFARRLLDAADDPAQVRTDTSSGGAIAFVVPAEVAEAAGFPVSSVPESGAAEGGDRDDVDTDTAGTDTGDLPPVPAGNDSREEWAAFLTAAGIAVPPDAGRNDLRALWATDPRAQ